MNAAILVDSTNELSTRRIFAEQVRLLYAQAPLSALANALIAPLLVLVLWPVIAHSVLWAWLLTLEATLVICALLILAFRRDPHRHETPERWADRYTWACAACGICWGGCLFLLALSPSLVYQTFIALCLGGMLMGGVLTMTPWLTTCIFYSLPLVLPPTLWLLLQDDLMLTVMGITGILYLVLALSTAQHYHQTLQHSLRLGLDNLTLAESAAAAKELVEASHAQLAERQAALQDSLEAMREFYRVISTPRRHANDQIQALLAMGRERFGTAVGILAHIEGQRYEVIQTSGTGTGLAVGTVLPLEETYCNEAARLGSPLSIEHAATTRWREHLCYQKHHLETYLGAPVHIGGQPYGTLCFYDQKPRPTPFSSVDHELIQLMARWIGAVIEQDRTAAAVQRQHTLLVHASRLNTLGEMASGLAHEINQPITAIALYAETSLSRLRGGVVDPTEIAATLEKIASQSARTNTIIQHIRRFARQSKPHYLAVHTKALLDEIDDFLILETHRHEVRLQQHIPPNLPPVLADPLQFQQVILNLIHNAVDAMHTNEGPRTITLSARIDREMVEIGIEDTGPGVPPDIFSRLLHPFFTTKPDGLGLGLSISESIIEAHGGRLWATPNRERGVTFHFTLPIANHASLPEHPPTEPAPAAVGSNAG